MRIFGKNDIKISVPELTLNPGQAAAIDKNQNQSASSQMTQALSTLFLYSVVGGVAGFSLRALIYMAGYKQWLFVHIPSFISFGGVFKAIDDKWGSFFLIIIAFSGSIYGLYFAIKKFLSGRRSVNG
ncbi:MAG: hypothetical protein PHN84_12545 [Desulfuromonadaceae bacterium]|nr:hypothetical protein [Desulfuromonadaceae bacterium]MDD2855797.1 hypothetical protein [Desulfuromonadaceae bacterium]